jgi:hypothetical protein
MLELQNTTAFIQSLLNGASSYSRDILEEEVRSGKDRTLAQAIIRSDVTLTLGYYRLKGNSDSLKV